jgi:cyclophilin family peptidyl-prolyl cis-trans isomerase
MLVSEMRKLFVYSGEDEELIGSICATFIVFGRVTDGMDVVKYIETVPKGPGDRPKEAVTISDSGEVSAKQVKDEL